MKANKLSGLTGTEQADVAEAKDALLSAASTLIDPTKAPAGEAALETVKAQADVLSGISDIAGGNSRADATGLLKGWAAKLGILFDDVQPEQPREDAFELYEIIQSGPTTTLRRVGL